MVEEFRLDTEPTRDSDRRAELMLGALVCLVVVLLLGMFAFVLYQAIEQA